MATDGQSWNQQGSTPRKTGALLILGIFLAPYLFAWLTLRRGYANATRLLSFAWACTLLFAMYQGPNNGSSNRVQVADAAVVQSVPRVVPARATTVTDQAPASSAAPAQADTGGWTYDRDSDDMRGSTTSFGRLESADEQEFGFPYKGGHATLTLRERPKDGLNVMLQIAGQFICSSYRGDYVSVKFDSGSIQRFGCAEPASGGTGTLFIEGEKRFLTQLLRSRRLVIEANFYETGPRQMHFITSGLQWPPKPGVQ